MGAKGRRVASSTHERPVLHPCFSTPPCFPAPACSIGLQEDAAKDLRDLPMQQLAAQLQDCVDLGEHPAGL